MVQGLESQGCFSSKLGGGLPVSVLALRPASSSQSRSSPGLAAGTIVSVPAFGRQTGGQSQSAAALCVAWWSTDRYIENKLDVTSGRPDSIALAHAPQTRPTRITRPPGTIGQLTDTLLGIMERPLGSRHAPECPNRTGRDGQESHVERTRSALHANYTTCRTSTCASRRDAHDDVRQSA